jgi:hypothetical protein
MPTTLSQLKHAVGTRLGPLVQITETKQQREKNPEAVEQYTGIWD